MYAKVFVQILDSSIAEDYRVRHIFQDLLILADRDGAVDMTTEAISRRLNVPMELLNMALTALTQPDSHSRSSIEDGRRIIPIDPDRDWGWQIVNFKSYNEIKDDSARRERNRRCQAEHRARLKAKQTPVSAVSAPVSADSLLAVAVAVAVPTTEETTLPPSGGDQISESAKPRPKKEKIVKKKPDDPPAPRPRNIWWDAICDFFNMKPVTRQDETRIGRLARDFKLKCDAAGVDPEEIEARRDVLAARWGKNDQPAVVTPEALLKHWDSAEDQGGRMPESRGPTEEETQEMYDAFDAKPTAVKRAEIEAFEKHLVETHQVREPETVARLAKVWDDIHREEAEVLAGKAAAV
jgi:hypothetical protein